MNKSEMAGKLNSANAWLPGKKKPVVREGIPPAAPPSVGGDTPSGSAGS